MAVAVYGIYFFNVSVFVVSLLLAVDVNKQCCCDKWLLCQKHSWIFFKWYINALLLFAPPYTLLHYRPIVDSIHQICLNKMYVSNLK